MREQGFLELVVLIGLATARLYQLLARDTITATLRDRLETDFPRVHYWLRCPWCSGFWLSLVVFGVWFTPVFAVVWLLAVAQVASMLAVWVHKTELIAEAEERDSVDRWMR